MKGLCFLDRDAHRLQLLIDGLATASDIAHGLQLLVPSSAEFFAAIANRSGHRVHGVGILGGNCRHAKCVCEATLWLF